MTRPRPLASLAALLLTAAPALAATDPRLVPAYHADMVLNGIATHDGDGRAFVCFSHPDGSFGAKIAEVTPAVGPGTDAPAKPYPDLGWNDWKPGDDPRHKFVGSNSLRFSPDGHLWVVDTGTTGWSTHVVPGGAKLVELDVVKNQVTRVIPLDDLVHPDSFIDDIRFNGPHAYLTDAGWPGLIVLDLASGHGRRVLNDDPSTTDKRDMRAAGKVLVDMQGKPARLHADQLEVSPDGRTFYFQPASGPMSAIDTKTLDDPSISPIELAKHVRPFYDTPTTGGTCIDADGNLYVSDVDRQRVFRLTPDGRQTPVVQDDRLVWGDAMWIDRDGSLLIPAQQLQRTAPYHGGISALAYPTCVYRLPLGLKPFRN